MNLARSVAAFLGALAASAPGVVGKADGIVQLDDEAIAGASPPPSTLDHKTFNINDAIERLNRDRRMSASSALRGGGQGGSDGADAAVQNLQEVKDAANDYVKQLETLQHQYENDKDAFASSLKAMVGSAQDVALLANQAREVDPIFNSPLNDDDLVETLDSFDLDIFPSKELAEVFQPELLGEVVENTRHIVGVLDGLDLEALNTNGRRLSGDDEHHDDMFDFNSDGDDTSAGFDFDSSEGPHQFHLRGLTNPMLRKMFNGMGGGKQRMKMPNNLRPHFKFDTASGKGQGRRRLQENAVCLPACNPEDVLFWKCNCKRLVGYATEISPYDLAVMYAKQYIGTDENSDTYGNFTVNITTLDLFDANDQLPEIANRISSMASAMANGDATTDNCNTLLREFHTAIGLNESRQLSVDEVGEAVHTDIKLDVREIVEKYDGLGQLNPFADGNQVDQEVWGPYFSFRACNKLFCTEPGDYVNCNMQYLTTPFIVLCDTDMCNPYEGAKRCRAYMDQLLQQYETEWRQAVKPNSNDPIQCNSVSYAACAVFADSFDLLYQGRNMTTHPDDNPMRKSESQPVHPSTGDSALELVNFPIANTYTTDEHGVKTSTGYENAPGLERFPGSLDTFRGVWSVNGQDNYWVACSNKGECGSTHQPEPPSDKYHVKCCSNTTAGSDFWKRSPFGTTWTVTVFDEYSCQYTLVLDSDADSRYGTNGVGQCPPPMTHDKATEFCAGYGGRLCTVEELVNGCAQGVGCGYEDKMVWSTQYSFQYSADTGCRSSQLDGTSTMAMEACDNSTSFLVGQHTSIGTVASLARVVEEKGPDRMPGKCCLDNPGTSALFGKEFDPDMECQHRGHWHLGISDEVCEAAGGMWTRSACITLQECIAGRPTNTSAGYSASFESFASNIDIFDASDEDECGNARQGLGFDKDYEFDTDVCDEFKNRMCDPFYSDLDDATDHPDPTWKDITYTPIQYPDDEDLNFTALPEMPTFQVVAEDKKLSDTVNDLQIAQQAAWTGYQTSMYLGRKGARTSGNTCESIASPLFLKAICFVVRAVYLFILSLAELLELLAWDGVSNALVSLSQKKTNWAKQNYQILSGLLDGDDSNPAWLGRSLDTINGNVYNQHKQVRKDLQDRHEQMVNDINQWTTDVANDEGCQIIKALGGECNPSSRRPLEGEPSSSMELDVSWPVDEDLVGGENVWEILKTIHERVTSIKNTLEIHSGGDPPAPTKRSKKAKQAKVAGLPANLFEAGTESEASATAEATEASMSEAEENDINQLSGKDDVIEGKFDAMEVKKLNAKIDALEVKMNGMEVKIDALSDDMRQMKDLIMQLVPTQSSHE